MAPPFSVTKATLSHPIFAADFDPYNDAYLVLGGGGGEGRSGVPNTLTVLDVSSRERIVTVAEIELSRDEDSVQSLANVASKGGLRTFAGINSSAADQKAGRNEHLRCFHVTYPPAKRRRTEEAADQREDGDGSISKVDGSGSIGKQDGSDSGSKEDGSGSIELLDKRSLFTTPKGAKKETYQRLLRLSPPLRRGGGGKRLGAIASGLGEANEIVVFDATLPAPDPEDVLTRINTDDEANDVDMASPALDEFSLSYCTDYDIYEQTYKYDFAAKKAQMMPRGPRRIHQMPLPDASEDPKSRPKFRGIRFLTPTDIITLSNKPNKTGAELRIFHLYPTGPATLLFQKTLSSRIKQASGLDVCALDADKDGRRHIVVAVAGQDISIEVLTLNYWPHTSTFSSFNIFTTLKNVHPQQMTKIVFSPFHSPTRAPERGPSELDNNGYPVESKSAPAHPGPQYIRLASVSYGNTVVVDTFALTPLDPTTRNGRYVLSHPSDENRKRNLYIGLLTFIVLVSAYLLQAYITGASDTGLGVAGFLPPGARGYFAKPANAAQQVAEEVYTGVEKVADALPSSVPGRQSLLDLLHAHHPDHPSYDPNKGLIVRDAGDGTALSINTHPDKAQYLRDVDEKARHWHELHEHEQRAWKAKLTKAGHWSANYAETLLKGVLFSEYAGMVGQAAGEVIREGL